MNQHLYLLFFIFLLSGCQKVTEKTNQSTMRPFFKEGDRLVIDKSPKEFYDYGDVVICQFDNNKDQYYILRVVGLPEDSLGMEDYTCIINGKKNPRQLIADSATYYYKTSLIYTNEVCEELPNGKKVNLYIERDVKVNEYYIQEKANIKTHVSEASIPSVYIPPNHYYVLGDARARAIDSRLLGSVAKENIKGRIIRVIPTIESTNY